MVNATIDTNNIAIDNITWSTNSIDLNGKDHKYPNPHFASEKEINRLKIGLY